MERVASREVARVQWRIFGSFHELDEGVLIPLQQHGSCRFSPLHVHMKVRGHSAQATLWSGLPRLTSAVQ